MKAVGVNSVRRKVEVIADHPEPRIETKNEAKIRMMFVGICGTDREIMDFQYGVPPPGFEYLVIGHESLGVVTEIGEEVRNIAAGDLVVIMVRRPCPHRSCAACRAGRPDFCYTGDFTERGIKGRHGFLTEYVVEEETYLIRVPSSLRDVGVLAEPLTIAEKALQQIRNVQDRMPWRMSNHERLAVVLGAGAVGLLGAMLLRRHGYRTIVYSREPAESDRASLLRNAGIEYVSSQSNTISEFVRNFGAPDVVYEATGAAGISFKLLEHLQPNGIFVFTGVPGRKKAVGFDAASVMRNIVLENQIILGTVNAGKDSYLQAVQDLEHFLQEWPASVNRLITNRNSLENFATAVTQDGIKNIIAVPPEL